MLRAPPIPARSFCGSSARARAAIEEGANAAAKMLDSSVEPERFAERVVVLLDSAEGLMARTHRLSEQLRSEEKRFKALKEPEWKGVRSKLTKAFPELPDLSRDSKRGAAPEKNRAGKTNDGRIRRYESFQKSAAGTMGELKYAYELFLDLEAHVAVHAATLKAMAAQLACWDLTVGRESSRAFVALFSAFVRVVALAGMVDDRRLVCSLYAAAHACARGSSEPKFARLAQQSLRTYDEPFRSVGAVLADYVPVVGTLVKNVLKHVLLIVGGSGELLRRNALTMLEDNLSLGQPTMAPLDAQHKGRSDVPLLHGELLEGRGACDFVVFATLATPGVLADPGCLACCQLACEDSLVAGVYRSSTVNVHAELEGLGKAWPPRGYAGKWPRDLKLSKTFKEWSKAAVLNCGHRHRERRAYLCGELDVMQGLLTAVPGLAAPKAPLAVAACALAHDEVLWALRHSPANGAAAYPPKYRVKHYDADNFSLKGVEKLAAAAVDLGALLRRERRAVARYHVEFLARADAAALEALGARAAAALPADHVPRNAPAFLERLGDRLAKLGDGECGKCADDALAAMARAERDGHFVGGRGAAAGLRRSTLGTLVLDWRRVHFVLVGSTHAASMLKDGSVRDACARLNLVVDHCGLADGSLALAHCDAGAWWPYRLLLEDAAAAALKSGDALAAPRALRAMLATARAARRTQGHPAQEGDCADLERDARAFGERTLDLLRGCVSSSLRTIAAKEDQLACQIAPVEAAYRLERREAAQRDLDRKGGGGERAKEEPPAGYESLPANAAAVQPLAVADARLAATMAWAKSDHREDPDASPDTAAVVVGDAKLRPAEAARDAVLAFLDRQIPRAFFDDEGRLIRPTTAERVVGSALAAAARAAGYVDVDYAGHVYRTLGPRGGPDSKEHSPLAGRVADAYVAAVRGLPRTLVYCPERHRFQSAVESRTREPLYAETLLSAPELDALFRVLGADGARCLDGALARAAVDEMARCKKCVCGKHAVKALEACRRGALGGDWVPHAAALREAGYLDQLVDAAIKLGNLLALRNLGREALARTSHVAAPHLLKTALLALDTLDAATACKAAPPWLLPPPRKHHDPTYHRDVGDEDSPLYRALVADSPYGAAPFERDGNLHAEAAGLVDSVDEWALLPTAFAVALSADAWKPARWVPALNAFDNGHHVISLAIRALAHVSSGPPGDARAAQLATTRVADFVAAGAAAVTWMRLHEKEPHFCELPLRAQCAFLEAVALGANLPRSFLEEHLPYPVIHASLMDIAMDRQTALDEKARPFDPSAFDVVASEKPAGGGE